MNQQRLHPNLNKDLSNVFIAKDIYDPVILGCVNVLTDEMNPARVAALRRGMGESMPVYTVQINCGSGMRSIDSAYKAIRDSAEMVETNWF